MTRGHKRSHRRRSHRRRSYRHRGGAAEPIAITGPVNSQNAPSPSSYSSAATYQMASTGSGDSQYNRVFDINGPGGSTQAGSIIGIQGQRAGSRKRRGGFFGQVIGQAAVPLTILGMQQTYRRRGRKTRRNSRRR